MVAAASVASVLWAIARLRPRFVEVRGESMWPTLRPGDLALAVPARRIRRGRVVVLEHPARPGVELVKRVIAAPGDLAPDGRVLGPGECWVEGDAPARSTDSRQLGAVAPWLIRGRILAVCWPPSRWRVVRPGRPPLPALRA